MANRISDYLTPYKIRLIENLNAPELTATPEGTTGTTRYEYKASYRTHVGESLACDMVAVTNGNATLNGFNKVKLSTGTLPESVLYVRYWKNFFTYITATTRVSGTPYVEGDYVVLASNALYRYECTTAGTTAGSLPTGWPETVGETLTDGTVVWTCRSNQSNDWQLLGEVTAAVAELYDTGQSGTVATVPAANTSGRPGVIAIGVKPATFNQRQTWSDFMGLVSNMVQDLGDTLHRDGDVKEGCLEYNVSGNTWGFTAGKIYLLGRFIDVPSGQVTLNGVGTEKVGLTITPVYSTPDDDLIQRCAADEAVLPEYAATGPDWLYFELTWVKDTDGQVDIKEFIDGVPKVKTIVPERTELERTLARRTNAVSGSFCVRNFPMRVVDHPTDTDKLQLKVNAGYAFVNGFELETIATQDIDFYRGRSDGTSDSPNHIATVNGSTSDDFEQDGAYNDWNYWSASTVYAENDIIVPTILNGYRYKCTGLSGDNESGATEPEWTETPGGTLSDGDLTWTCLDDDYDLNGLELDVTVGSGNTHTVTFAADDMTAAQVVAAIEAELNAYPTAGEPDLVNGTAAEAILQLQAQHGKSLTLAGAAALKQLGWAAGTTEPTGTRIYQVNNDYIKQIYDITYKTERVVQVTYNTATKTNLLSNNLDAILGACDSTGGGANPLKNCHDHKWDLELGVDFTKNGNYIDFNGMAGSEPGGGAAVTYYVKIREVHNATKGVRQLIRVTDAKVVKSGEDLPDDLTYTDATSIVRVNGGAAVVPVGDPVEVISIERINNSPGQSTNQYTAYNLVTNSGALEHGTSYIDWSVAGTPGTTGDGQPSNSATYYVTYLAWYHATEGDIVTADSYDMYEYIGLAPNNSWLLRDCVDFRTTNSTLPKHGQDAGFDYDYYLSRVDKLVLGDLGNFQLITGSPAYAPPTPPDQSAALTLAILRIPPYTYTSSSVSVVSVEPLRITQKGIQRLQERIERLEYWQMVNGLESEAEENAPEGADLQGIFTDALTGWGRMDLAFDKNGVTCNAALDRYNQCLLLSYTEDKKLIAVDEGNSTGIRRAGNSVMLDYQPEVIIEQPKASIWVNGATDFAYSSYFGRMVITPETQVWVDEEQLPQINVDFDNQFTGLINALNPLLAAQIDWSNWSNGVPGSYTNVSAAAGNGFNIGFSGLTGSTGLGGGWVSSGSREVTTTSTTRTGTYTQLVPGAMTYETISGISDISLQYYMRTVDENGNPFEVQLDITGLMPNVDHACTINGIVVDLTYDDSPVNAAGEDGAHTYSGKTTAKTSNIGSLTAKFNMPHGVLAGTAIIRVFYYSDPDISTCWANFYSAGLRVQAQDTAIGIPDVSAVPAITIENGIVENITEVDTSWGWVGDPLAQTFTLPSLTYVSAVGLYFKSKSDTLGYRVELWKCQNGHPSRDAKTPYASKHLLSSEITTSDDASVETVFTFDHVLGYSPNEEWAFIGFPDQSNTDYQLWCSEIGTIDVATEERITTHPHNGTLLHSPNARTWASDQPWSKRDLKFKIYKSNFEENCRIEFDNLTGVQAGRFIMAFDQFVGGGVNVKWFYSTDGGVVYVPFNPHIDQDFGQEITQVKLRVDVTSLGGSYEVIDKYIGIYLRYFDASCNYISQQEYFTDPLLYPNKISATMSIDADSINSGTGTLVTCMGTIDDGESWFVIPQKEGYISVADIDPYYMYAFETPDEASVSNATNAEPIVVTSAGHGYTDGMIVVVAAVEGNTNANGTWVVTNATTDTFELYTTAGVASSGNSAYTTGGTITFAEFEQFRGRVQLSTDTRHRTPRVRKIAFLTSQVA